MAMADFRLLRMRAVRASACDIAPGFAVDYV